MMTMSNTAFIFLEGKDPLAALINEKANKLFLMLRDFNGSKLVIEEGLRSYFINHHLGHRLFFSIQNSAHIIYQSVQKSGKAVDEINIVDYGAGLGTLYLLGGLLNFKRVIYNDYLPEWKNAAAAISAELNIPITEYITGDIDALIDYASSQKFKFDIIASRNVIEHIYDLSFFFSQLYKHNSRAVIFSTTSANYHNFAMRLKHYLLHKKVEKEQYGPIRKKALIEQWPEIKTSELNELLKLTRGKACQDFLEAIDDYKKKRQSTPVPFLRTNTCLHDSGLWCEHLLTKNEYNQIIHATGYTMEFTAGYWDTHYKSVAFNMVAKQFNKLIELFGKKGHLFSPFVNIVALPPGENK